MNRLWQCMGMDYFTEDQLRALLKQKINGRTYTDVAKDAGISLPMMSMLMNGAPMTGRILSYLGFRKIKRRLYERVRRKGSV